jgi:putative transcriptional regulator
MKKKTRLRTRSTVAQRIHRGMDELEQAMRGDATRPLTEFFTIRTVEVPDPATYDARAVKRVRDRLHVSQAVFAKLLGVSVELVENWEQDLSTPRPLARRLLDEISQNPSDFLNRNIGHAPSRLRRAG